MALLNLQYASITLTVEQGLIQRGGGAPWDPPPFQLCMTIVIMTSQSLSGSYTSEGSQFLSTCNDHSLLPITQQVQSTIKNIDRNLECASVGHLQTLFAVSQEEAQQTLDWFCLVQSVYHAI